MNGVPDIDQGDAEEVDGESPGSDDDSLTKQGSGRVKPKILCAPYIQIFKNGQRIFQSLSKK